MRLNKREIDWNVIRIGDKDGDETKRKTVKQICSGRVPRASALIIRLQAGQGCHIASKGCHGADCRL